jgi:NhaP-type Na+/H+ or K+/H+ antiporter
MHHGTETVGKVLELLVLLTLGSMLTITGLGGPGLAGWLLAPLLVLVIRPLLVLATTNPRLMNLRSRVFLGFFGVRGVAAVFYAAAVVNSHALPSGEQHVVVWTTIACVVTSVVVHGVSATPLTKTLLGRAP